MALVSVAWCTKKQCLAHRRGKLILPTFPFAMSVYLVKQYHVQNIDEQHWTREGAAFRFWCKSSSYPIDEVSKCTFCLGCLNIFTNGCRSRTRQENLVLAQNNIL